MTNISAIIIAKNAEEMIGDCIDSVKFCDEIIVVDNNSTDRTVELLKILGIKVFTYGSESFAELRNYGLKKTKGKWVLYVDSDERVTPELASSIKHQASSSKNEYSAFKLKRKNFYFGNHEWPYVEKLERLFKKEDLKKWKGKLHETPIISGEVGELDGLLLHYSHRDLTSMLEKTIDWSETEAELRFNTNHPKMSWWRFFRVMITAFWNSYITQKGYKAGTAGLIESIYQSFSMFITYARLWELQEEDQKSKIKSQK